MGSMKDRNGMDLTEAEDIKKRWQEYMEELYKNDLHNQDNHDKDAQAQFEKMVDALEDLEDVQQVYHNVDLGE